MPDRIWLKNYPRGVPADIDADHYRSIPDCSTKSSASMPSGRLFTISAAR
jgi:long-chain acyl-CoA synthetase